MDKTDPGPTLPRLPVQVTVAPERDFPQKTGFFVRREWASE